MATNKKPAPYQIVLLAILMSGGIWLWTNRQADRPESNPGQEQSQVGGAPATDSFPQGPDTSALPERVSVRVDGSTSMVSLMKAFTLALKQAAPGSLATWQANGTEAGKQALLSGRIEIAAASNLTGLEDSQGLEVIQVAADDVAIVVGTNNAFSGDLTTDSLRAIFTGQITNWNQLGGANKSIRVIERAASSGTAHWFQAAVLNGQPVSAQNLTVMPNDETTGILRLLGDDGISYATYDQVRNQRTVRALTVNGRRPGDSDYQLKRPLYFLVRKDAPEAVKAAARWAASAEGQQAIARYNF